MTMRATWSVLCDSADFGVQVPGCLGFEGTCNRSQLSRNEARREGWRIKYFNGVRRDLCPRCYQELIELGKC